MSQLGAKSLIEHPGRQADHMALEGVETRVSPVKKNQGQTRQYYVVLD